MAFRRDLVLGPCSVQRGPIVSREYTPLRYHIRALITNRLQLV
jgi:hypothetical protein